MLTIKYYSAFKKDYKKLKKRKYDISQLETVIQLLADEKPLPARCRNHRLSGEFDHCWECHIAPDWLLIYAVDDGELILYLMRTGSHSDLF